jgi:hypothetical protein
MNTDQNIFDHVIGSGFEIFECSQHAQEHIQKKNTYIPKSKTTLLLLSFNVTMLAEIQGENKRRQEVKTTKATRGQENGQTCIFLFFFSKLPFSGYISH